MVVDVGMDFVLDLLGIDAESEGRQCEFELLDCGVDAQNYDRPRIAPQRRPKYLSE